MDSLGDLDGDFFWHFGGWDNGPFYNFVLASRTYRAGIVILTNGGNGDLFEDIVAVAIGGDFPIFPWSRFFSSYFSDSG